MISENFKRITHILFCILFLTCLALADIHAQKKDKVQIVLLGTFHLTPSTSDLYKNKKIDLHTISKQKEIQEVVNKLAAFNPQQICLEYPMEDQIEMDSIYNAYFMGRYKLRDNERDLFGFQAVKKSGIKTPTCINYSYGHFNADTVSNFALQNNQTNILERLQQAGSSFTQEIDSNLTKLSLRNFLIFCNTEEALQTNLGLYTKYFARIGKDRNYTGADLVADWYSTNIHIYTNILRIVKPTDKRIIVIFGQGHIPILKHLFSNNSDFEVIEVKDILK
ncbi:MAG: hypothetical protein K2Q24_05970 [Chitinophagaceae bacterium]|jgi:hypothetical protein|nr:hypothetical protein [Chitinophagaceae bacterium]